MIKKYLKKDIYLQKRQKKLLMIWDYYSSIIMEHGRIIATMPNHSEFKTKNWVKINDD